MKQHPFTFQQTGNEYCLTALHHLSVEEYAKYINLDHKLITTSAHQGLTWLLLSDHPLISWPLSLPQIRSQIQRFFGSFFNWIRQLMHKCGGKDVYFNDGSIIKGAFEGFPGGGLEKLEHMTWDVALATSHISSIIPIYYIEPLCIESLLPRKPCVRSLGGFSSRFVLLSHFTHSSHDLFLSHRSAPKSSYTSTIFRLGAPTNGGRKDIHFNNRHLRAFLEGVWRSWTTGIRCCYIPIYYTMCFLTNGTVQGLNCMCVLACGRSP